LFRNILSYKQDHPAQYRFRAQRFQFMLIQARGQTCRRVEGTDRDALCEEFGGVSRKWIAEADPFGLEIVWLTTEQQDRILGGMEHPAIQIETAVERLNAVEPALQRTGSRGHAKKN
jgi:hypothetical protein